MTDRPKEIRDKVYDLLHNFDDSANAQIVEYVDEFTAALQHEAALDALRLGVRTVSEDRVIAAIERVYTQKYRTKELRQKTEFAAGVILGAGVPLFIDQFINAQRYNPAAWFISFSLIFIGSLLALYSFVSKQ